MARRRKQMRKFKYVGKRRVSLPKVKKVRRLKAPASELKQITGITTAGASAMIGTSMLGTIKMLQD